MDSSDDSFLAEAAPPTRRTISLARAVEYPALEEGALIPGVDYFVQERIKSISSSEFAYAVQNLGLGDKKLFDALLIRRVVENYPQLLGQIPSKQTDVFLTKFSYQDPSQLRDPAKREEEAERLLDTAPETALEIYMQLLSQNKMNSHRKVQLIVQRLGQADPPREKRTEIVHKLLSMCQQQAETRGTQQLASVNALCDACHELVMEPWQKNYVEAIRHICLLHLFEQQVAEEPETSFTRLVGILQSCFNYLQQLSGAQGFDDLILEHHQESAYVLLTRHFYPCEEWFQLQQDFAFDQAYGQFHLNMATMFQILSAFYLMQDQRSPLTGEPCDLYPLKELFQFKRHGRRVQSFELVHGEQSNLMEFKSSWQDSFSDDFSSEVSKPSTSQLPPNQRLEEKACIDEKLLIHVAETALDPKLRVLIQSRQNILMAMAMTRQFAAVFNPAKPKLDAVMTLAHKQILDVLSNMLPTPIYGQHIRQCFVSMYSQIENVVHLLFTTLRQANQRFCNNFTLQHLTALAQLAASKKTDDYTHFNIVRLRLSEFAFQTFQNEETSQYTTDIYRTQAQIYADCGEWTKEVTQLIQLVKFMRENHYDPDQILQLAVEVAGHLFDKGEFDLAQEYFCYACELSGQSQSKSVINDERRSIRSPAKRILAAPGDSHSGTSRKFYEAIQNVQLMEQLSSSWTDLSETTSTSNSSSLLDGLSRETFEIYLKRVQCYQRLNNFKPAIRILQTLLAQRQLHDTMRVEILQTMCSIYLQCSQTVCQAELETFQQLEKALLPVTAAATAQMLTKSHSILAQFYWKCGYPCQALALGFGVYGQRPDQQRQFLMLVFNVLKGLIGQSIYVISSIQFNFTDELKGCYEGMLGCELVEQMAKNRQEQEVEFPVVKIDTAQKSISLELHSEEACVQLLVSVYTDLIRLIDENSQQQQKLELVSEYLYLMAMVDVSQVDFKKLETRSAIISFQNGILTLGFNAEQKQVSLDDTYMLQLAKEAATLLPQTTHLLNKPKMLLGYAALLLNEGKQSGQAVQILQNVVAFVYAAFMAGPISLPALFDANVSQLLQLQQIYNLIIYIAGQLSPVPDYLPLFIDACVMLEHHLTNNLTHKFYPHNIQESSDGDVVVEPVVVNGETVTLENVRLFGILPTRFPADTERLLDSYRQILQKPITCALSEDSGQLLPHATLDESAREKIQKTMGSVRTVITEGRKGTGIGQDRTSIQLYQAYAMGQYGPLSLYNKQVQMNRLDYVSRKRSLQPVFNELTAFSMGRDFVVQLTLQRHESEESTTQQRSIFEISLQDLQQRTQQVVNAADVVRGSLSVLYQLELQLPIGPFLAQYYGKTRALQYFVRLNGSVFWMDHRGQLQTALNLWPLHQRHARQVQPFSVEGQQFAVKPYAYTTGKSVMPNDYINQLLLGSQRQANTSLNPTVFKQVVTSLTNLFQIQQLDEARQALEQFGPEGVAFHQLAKEPGANLYHQFLGVMTKMQLGHTRGLDMLRIAQLQTSRAICASVFVQALPFEHCFNGNFRRCMSQFEFGCYLEDQRRAEALKMCLLQSVQVHQQIIVNGNSKFDPAFFVKTSTGVLIQGDGTPGKKHRQGLQQSAQYLRQFNQVYLPQILQFCNPIDAAGRKESQYEEQRKQWMALLAKLTFGCRVSIEHIGSISDLDEFIYCNTQGVLTPHQSQMLKYGQRDFGFSQRKIVGKTALCLDCSDKLLERGVLLRQHCRLYEVPYLVELAKNAPRFEFDLSVTPANVTTEPEEMAFRRAILQYDSSSRQLPVLVTTWGEYLQLPDALMTFLQQRSPVLVVPASCVSAACEFIHQVAEYIEAQQKEPSFQGSILEMVVMKEHMLLDLLAFVLRRSLCVPIALWW